MKRWLVALAAAVGIGVTTWAAPVAAADAPYCGIRWGSLAKEAGGTPGGHLTGVRAGRHDCYDRLVLDVDAGTAGYRARYVPEVRADGSGHVVALRGGARLEIIAIVPAHDDYRPTYRPANSSELVNVAGWRTFRQVASAGSFEGQTTVGLGVRARLPFRVFTIDGPGTGSRLVIDVAHRW